METCRFLQEARGFREPNRLHRILWYYLTGANEIARGRERVDAFKDSLLVHRPETYRELYDEEGEPIVQDEDVDWQVPSTETDVQDMMAQLAALESGSGRRIRR